MSYYGNILEEELKNKVAHDLFNEFDTTQIIGRIDFCVSIPADPLGLNETESLLWAEAKKGSSHSINDSFIQLILTLGKERPQDNILPPAFLGAFDADKIAFLPYNMILDVLRQNDFNWNVAPSDHTTKEFLELSSLLQESLNHGLEIYDYEKDAKELIHFIRHNFLRRKSGIRHIRINKNNFTHIYLKWLEQVKPTININWETAKKAGIIDSDFYLADILSKDNTTLLEKLFVLLQDDHYLLDRKIDDTGLEEYKKAQFSDNKKAHTLFWNKYARPPRREYWDYIVNRRDLLVPQDVRERKGSFFTPAKWVELSQQYLAAELGEDWQEEYYVWDCCAGTGNLLAGLTNKYNIYASTIDQADVQAMHQRIEAMSNSARDSKHGGANLLDSHVFQFDFLNDPFYDKKDETGNVVKSKLPKSLQEIIKDPEKCKKLVIYINPPYAEAGSSFSKNAKKGVSNQTKAHKDFAKGCGTYAKRELFVQFFMRIYIELPTAILAEFSKLKILQAPYFREFRKIFLARLGNGFLVPANTFDNVKGKFPIGFLIWHLNEKERFTEKKVEVYDSKSNHIGYKTLSSYDNSTFLNDWLRPTWKTSETPIGWMVCNGNDFQHQNELCILSKRSNQTSTFFKAVTRTNILRSAIYFSVRHCIEATWLNDRDQYLFPNDSWEEDPAFQSDCLVYTLFHGQNRISCQNGVNHWIPFTEDEVGAQEKFDSHFMIDYIHGKMSTPKGALSEPDLFYNNQAITPLPDCPHQAIIFTPDAQSVMDAGRNLWRHYHAQPIGRERPNVSYYDIRLYFQGTKTTSKGKIQMNSDSSDVIYNQLINELRQRMKVLGKKIEPKVYEHGFLK